MDLIVERKKLKVDKIKYFILDECDAMLEETRMRSDI